MPGPLAPRIRRAFIALVTSHARPDLRGHGGARLVGNEGDRADHELRHQDDQGDLGPDRRQHRQQPVGEDAGEVERQADEEQAEERGAGAELPGEEGLPGGELRVDVAHPRPAYRIRLWLLPL